jgi:hypothetical protein
MNPMVNEFLTIDPDKILILAIGDLIGHTWSEDTDYNAKLIAACRASLQESRLFDIRPQWPTMMRAAHQENIFIASDDEYETLAQLSDDTHLPLYSLPAIGIYGWYQTDNTQATIVAPTHVPGGSTLVDITWLQNVSNGGSFIITVGTYIVTKDAEWHAGINIAPLNKAANATFRAMPVDDRPDWLKNNMAFSSQSGQQQAMFLVRRAKAILLTNTFIQCDKGMVKKSSVPPRARAKTRKLTGKKGSPGRMWIDLPGLRYENGHLSTVGSGNQLAWHPVRGHPRTLTSDKFTNMQGKTIWVRPHSKGSKDIGTSVTPYRIK